MKNAGLTLSIALKASLGRTGTVTWWRTCSGYPSTDSIPLAGITQGTLLSSQRSHTVLPWHSEMPMKVVSCLPPAARCVQIFLSQHPLQAGGRRPTAACRKEAKASLRCLPFRSGTQFCDPSPCPSQTLQPHTPNPRALLLTASIASSSISRFRDEPPSPHPPWGRLLASSGARPGPEEPPAPPAASGGARRPGRALSGARRRRWRRGRWGLCSQDGGGRLRAGAGLSPGDRQVRPGDQGGRAGSAARGSLTPPRPRFSPSLPARLQGALGLLRRPPLTALLFFRISGTARGRWAPSRSSTRPWRRNSGTSGAASRWGWRGWAEGGLEAVRVLIPRINGC